jgi:hypothetical protein
MEIQVKHGNVVLDFTQAEIARPTLQLDVDLRHSNLILITRPGVVIDADDLLMNSGNVRLRPSPEPQHPEVLRVDLAGQIHHGNVVARVPRRSFWAWLRRRPYAPLPPGAGRP